MGIPFFRLYKIASLPLAMTNSELKIRIIYIWEEGFLCINANNKRAAGLRQPFFTSEKSNLVPDFSFTLLVDVVIVSGIGFKYLLHDISTYLTCIP